MVKKALKVLQKEQKEAGVATEAPSRVFPQRTS